MARWHNLGELTDRDRSPDDVAIIDLRTEAPRAWTHRDIDTLANSIAGMLATRALPRGTRVAILSLNRAEYIATWFGILRAGLAAVPVNVKLPNETIDFILRDCAAELAFVDAAHAPLVAGRLPLVSFDDADLAAPPGPTVVPEPGEIAHILYNSGSTGRPKGVPLSHHGQLWVFEQMMRNRPANPDPHTRGIVVQPLFHMNGLYQTASVVALHTSMVIMPSYAARSYLQAIAGHHVTNITAVPTMLARAFKEIDLLEHLDFSAVKLVRVGSAPVTQRLLEQIGRVFANAGVHNGYGTTEGGAAVFGPHPQGKPAPLLSVGYPLAAGELRLVDGPDDDEGVLEMRNPAVMAGYLNLPEATAKVLHHGWYRSGDVFRRDADGFYFFVGRADDMFVCSAENIYPGEVEKMLERHPAVHQACVVPLPDEERGQIPTAFIVRRAGAALDAAALKQFALANAPAYQHPRRVAFVADLPWAGTNKIDRTALIAEARTREAENRWSA